MACRMDGLSEHPFDGSALPGRHVAPVGITASQGLLRDKLETLGLIAGQTLSPTRNLGNRCGRIGDAGQPPNQLPAEGPRLPPAALAPAATLRIRPIRAGGTSYSAMNATTITCPHCGLEIALSDALNEQFRHENEARLAALAAAAQQQARADVALERQLLESQLAEERKKREEAQLAELELRKEKGALEERRRELDLEVARRIDSERQRWEKGVRRGLAEEQGLKLKEKDKLIDELRQALDEAKRKSEQGLTERQGEVLELDVQAELERRFPQDVIAAVGKGVRGADLLHEVRDHALRLCGTIVWETKNTKHWQPGWLDKLKQDQRAIGANLAVIVSSALPDGLVEFGHIDGVWVAGLRAWPALAVALRQQLMQVAFAHAAAEGKHEKMECLYRYLAGDQFKNRIEAMLEAFTALQSQLNRERTAMERIWKEREKQIERVIANIADMHGEVRGILGASVPAIPALELEAIAGRVGDADGAIMT